MMKPLDPKITAAEIETKSHDTAAHVGKAGHFRDTLRFLMHMGVFGRDTKPRIAGRIYVEESENKLTKAMEKAGKPATLKGDRRLDGLMYGRSSFIDREAQYFHDAFRMAVGHEWADQVPVSEFINTPIRQTIATLVRSGLPGPWETLDPVAALRIIEASLSDSAEKPAISIQMVSGLRISHQGDDAVQDIARVIDSVPLKPGTELYVMVGDLPAGSAFLILEYAADTFTHPSRNEPLQAQIMRHAEQDGSRIKVVGKSGTPLMIQPTPGEYGYCVIAYPDGWDAAEAFGIDLDATFISTDELRDLVRNLRHLMLEHRSVSMALVDYHVPSS